MKPHKHAELIKAWADGAEIEYRRLESWGMSDWEQMSNKLFVWHEGDVHEYRIKPEPKPDIEYFAEAFMLSTSKRPLMNECRYPNIKLTFDGETGELKSAEVLKKASEK